MSDDDERVHAFDIIEVNSILSKSLSILFSSFVRHHEKLYF